ncbi:O-succinylhomoserine sulfhydrylase [Caulobacter sp. S45]|uniref:O-succinylhomoserine sulfhydrylase n=1 Tax=Caulobacter sp. S45 TaxID=1641861 RepID=UPI00131D4AB8|nr:O-succinylhomoserine sulfhydrylase [Caulobacter sp. S45]
MSDDNREDPNAWAPATRLIRGGMARSNYGEISEPIFLTQSFAYDSAEAADRRFSGEEPGFIYARYGNPTVKMFEDRLALLEGAQACRAAASGMAAIHTALVGLLKAGDHLVASRALFGSCRWIIGQLLPRFGVETTFVDGTDLDAWRAAMRPNTRVCFLESPANPLLEIVDVAAVAQIAHAGGARLVVDNAFASPILQKPLTLGADIVIYSATKHIDGQGRVLGGAILGDEALLEESYKDLIRHTGPALSPFSAWVLLKGMETLELRVMRQSETAARLADLAAGHANVRKVLYPGRADHPQHALAMRQMSAGGTILAFDLGARGAAFRFLNALQIVDISNNLADAKSMAVHPSTTTHRSTPEPERLAIGLTEGFVRLSAGLEAYEDLARDVTRALDEAGRDG